MAHIPDGVLSAPVLVTGGVVSAGLIALALRRVDDDALPEAAVLASAFFVASLISVPIGPASVHLLLNGLMGLLLGWTAVPALFIALLLQAIFFGYGGLLVLGVNTMNLALPALLCALLLRPWLSRRMAVAAPPNRLFVVGATAGALGVLPTAMLIAVCLMLSGRSFAPAAGLLLAGYLPLARVEPALLPGARHAR
jgi:cobalt/nickel transport system permease protein